MNNKAQTMGLAIMISIFVFIVGIMSVNFLMPEINTFRADIQCSDPTQLRDGGMVMCLITDIGIPYFIVIIFSLAIGIITARFTL